MAIFNTVPPLQAGAGIKFDGKTISTGAAPRNLLDNSDFRHPVNQRGQTSYDKTEWGGYTIDRWLAGGKGCKINLQDDGLNMSGVLIQNLPNPERYNGKVLTVAAKIDDIILCASGKVVYDGVWKWFTKQTVDGICTVACAINADNTISVHVYTESLEIYKKIAWAALYEGEYTAETLPAYQPKGYAAELAECQRYYRNYEAITLVPFVYEYEGITQRHYRLNFETPMRVNPTVDVSQLLEKQLWSTLSSSFKVYRTDMHGIVFAAISDIVSQSNCYVDGKLSISADL